MTPQNFILLSHGLYPNTILGGALPSVGKASYYAVLKTLGKRKRYFLSAVAKNNRVFPHPGILCGSFLFLPAGFGPPKKDDGQTR